MKLPYRIGFGYDVHAFSEDRKLMLGGVEIPFEKGLVGHSDADALLHAIIDALLGALALGDIGKHFPDDDASYKDSDSKILLESAYRLVMDNDYILNNIDATIVIEKPKIASYIDKMRETIAKIMNVSKDQISIKATTSERMGFVGMVEGVKAMATVLLIPKDN